MAVQLILVQFVEVRILVGQQVTLSKAEGIFLSGSVESLLSGADGRKNTIRRKPDEVTWVMQSAAGSRGHRET
jgi:hypothetical protein